MKGGFICLSRTTRAQGRRAGQTRAPSGGGAGWPACLRAHRPLSSGAFPMLSGGVWWPRARMTSMAKIKVAQPVVELDDDEMTRIIWSLSRTS